MDKDTPLKKTILSYLNAETASQLRLFSASFFNRITEIRLRAGQPLLIKTINAEHNPGYITTAKDIRETLERVSQYSLYAFGDALKQGYITLPGGHRVGAVGQVAAENGGMRHIGGLNFRVAHAIPGCADAVLPEIISGAEPLSIFNTLIVSPPGYGKTTLLRDIVRQLSNRGVTVGLVDERSEIAGCYQGVPQNDVGCRTDVLDGCPKPIGMMRLLRTMAPDIIAVDELGGEQDTRAVEEIIRAGVKLICTLHGGGAESIKKNSAFERFIVLDAPGKVGRVEKNDIC